MGKRNLETEILAMRKRNSGYMTQKEAVNLRIPYEWSPRPHFSCQLEQNLDLGPVSSVLNGPKRIFR